MKAMVLAAGLGTRLRPLTLQRAKPALRLVDRSVLNHVLAWLAREGVNEVVINLHHLPETLRRTVLDGAPPGLKVHWSPEPEILGTGGGLQAASHHFRDEDRFLLVNGDCYYDLDLGGVLAAHTQRGADATMVLLPMPEGDTYAAVEYDADRRLRRIAGFPEATAPDPSWTRGHYPGVQVLTPAVLDRLPDRGFSDINRQGLAPMIEEGAQVLAHPTDGVWHDIGTPRRFLSACKDLLLRFGADIWAAPTAKVDKEAAVEGFCVLGEGARLEAGAHVRDSVLMDGAVVGAGCRIRQALIGYGTWLPEGSVVEERIRVEVTGRIEEAPIPGEAA